MSIEIKITDVSNLTVPEINSLTIYLLTASGNDHVLNELKDFELVIKESKTDNERKKRKRKAKSEPESFQLSSVIPLDEFIESNSEPIFDPIQQLQKDIESEPITPDELVAFVLENIREKKLDFVKVTEILQSFNVPNLNSLSSYPDLLESIHDQILGSLIK